MIRRSVSLLTLFIVCLPAAGQQPVEPIRLTIHPATAPVPALKYRLLPEVRDLSPGNAALLYQRAHSPEWMTYRQQKDHYEKMDEWLKKPLKDLLQDKTVYHPSRGILGELDLAARREYCDWEMSPRVRKDGIGLLLPDVQSFREFAALLSLQARLQMAEGKYADALRTLETSMAMGRHVGDAPILISALVGMAIVQITVARLEELIQQPEAPNLYWALTALPRPIVDMRKPMQGERLFLDSLFPGVRDALADPKHPVITSEQAMKMTQGLLAALSDFEGQNSTSGLNSFTVAMMAAKVYPASKKFLLQQGYTAEQLEAMPMLQAVLMFEVANYDRVYDELLKWQGLPFWEAKPGMLRAEQQLKEAKANNTVGTTLATLLLPAVMKVNEASVRADRRIAILRCVEAIRLHAAAHGGKLPATLSDIREVPVPTDPYSGKLFEYQMEEDKATLIAPPPPGEKPSQNNSMRYELTMKKK